MEEAAAAGSEREDALRREAMRAEENLRAAEMAVTDLASNAGDSSKPLLRQIEAMAAAAVRTPRPTKNSVLCTIFKFSLDLHSIQICCGTQYLMLIVIQTGDEEGILFGYAHKSHRVCSCLLGWSTSCSS